MVIIIENPLYMQMVHKGCCDYKCDVDGFAGDAEVRQEHQLLEQLTVLKDIDKCVNMHLL